MANPRNLTGNEEEEENLHRPVHLLGMLFERNNYSDTTACENILYNSLRNISTSLTFGKYQYGNNVRECQFAQLFRTYQYAPLF